MRTILRYGNIDLQICEEYSITKSSQDVEYSDITCDYTGHTRTELPEKYQEVKVIEINNNNVESNLFIGYVDTYKIPKMREIDIDTTIDISLFTPKKMTTLRTCIATGTYQLINLINKIFEPLIDDGFILQEVNITDRQVSVNYISETIEYCMNNLSNKFNLWWYIDENKGIYIKDISKLITSEPSYKYDNNNTVQGLEYIEPKTSSEGYANVVNFKNVRIYETSTNSKNPLFTLPIGTKRKGDIIEFNYPVDIKAENIVKSAKSNNIQGNTYYGLRIQGTNSGGVSFDGSIKVENGVYSMTSWLGFDGNTEDMENKLVLLIRDNFFSNLIVGFKWNFTSVNLTSITNIYSDSALIWNVNKFYNDGGISEKKNKISNSGIVETTIDMNESWKTIQELTEIGSSYLEKNSLNNADEIIIALDKKVFKIGDTIYINKMLVQGTYIITKIQEYYSNDMEYLVTAKNGNMLSNFIDVFRGENTEENDDKTYQVYITHYIEEGIAERYEVVQ